MALPKICKESVSPELLELLDYFTQHKAFDNFYLAGGTALALQICHRKSIDLDFFTPNNFETSLLSNIDFKYESINISNNSCEIFAKDTKIMFWSYFYELKYPLTRTEGYRFASIKDIAFQKFRALQGRSTKKDIIDLYAISKRYNLETLLKEFEGISENDGFNSYKSLEALIDLEVMQSEPNPIVLDKDISFEKAYDFVSNVITKHFNNLIFS